MKSLVKYYKVEKLLTTKRANREIVAYSAEQNFTWKL